MGRADSSFAIDRAANGALCEGDRIAMCGEVFAPLVGLAFDKLGDAPCRLAASIRDLPEVAVFSTSVSGLSMERTRALIAADGKAGFALTIIRRGSAQIVQRDREACVGTGEAALTTGADTVSLRFPNAVDGLTIMPSRAPLAALVPNLDDLVARPIPADSAALALLARYAEMVHCAPPDTPELRHLVAAHLFDLTALALGAIGEAADIARGRGARAARLAAIKQDIESNLTAPGLSIGALAARHAISPRYAARLFADEATTFSDYVRGRRLERARRMLVDPQAAHRAIGEIAYACGFNDLSYFNRCFRARYAATPGELRAEALAAEMAGASEAN